MDIQNHSVISASFLVLRCSDARHAGEAFLSRNRRHDSMPPLLVDHPMGLSETVSAWCGVGAQPDQVVAEALLRTAMSTMRIDASAASTVERQWQIESDNGDSTPSAFDLSRALAGVRSSLPPVEIVSHRLDQSRANGLSAVE